MLGNPAGEAGFIGDDLDVLVARLAQSINDTDRAVMVAFDNDDRQAFVHDSPGATLGFPFT